MKNNIGAGFMWGLLALVFSTVMSQVIDFMVRLNLVSQPSDIKFDDLSLVNTFLLLVVIAPIIEEFVYRFLPIKVIGLITKNRSALWIVIVACSLGFGISHGSWQHIFMQGIVGIIFSLAFLKEGYLSSVIAHATYNSVIFATLFYLKQI